MKPTDTLKLYRSGMVQRYHQNPETARLGQTNAAHQWGCAALLLSLHPAVPQGLLTFVLTHDVGELDAGDLSGPFKRANPDFAERHEAIETMHRHETLGHHKSVEFTLTTRDLLWWKLVDRLEACLFTLTHLPHVAARRKWKEQHQWCIDTSKKLQCDQLVENLFLKQAELNN